MLVVSVVMRSYGSPLGTPSSSAKALWIRPRTVLQSGQDRVLFGR